MTRPRTSPSRELYGLLGAYPNASAVLKAWNAYFSAQGIDAGLHRYPATEALLPERLSEMFHFDRRAYLVAPALQTAVLPLLDVVTNDAAEQGRVTVIINVDGVLHGIYTEDSMSPDAALEYILSIQH